MTILGETTLTFRRFAAGSRGSDGRWTNGSATSDTLSGSLQPLNGDELATLTEGERRRASRKLYTETALQVADQSAGTSADQVEVDGVWFEVRTCMAQGQVLPHYKATLLALQETE